MKRLLMVATVPSVFREFLLPFAHYFRSQGWVVDGMAASISDCAKCLESFTQVWDVEFSRNPLDPRNLLVALPRIREVISQTQYDIVHVHTPVAAFVTRYALKDSIEQPKAIVIYTAHGFHFHPGGTLWKNAAFLGLEKLAGNWTDYLVVINREDEAAAKRYSLVPSERVVYMPGIGVDIKHYSTDAVSEAEVVRVRQELGLAPSTSLFLSIAEFIPRKRPRDILQAFARLQKADVCLAFAGEGPQMDEMQQLAAKLGIEDRVRFLGYRQDIPRLICASRATVLVSEQEGLPRSVMESLSLKIPVIGTEIRGIRELLEGDRGLLVEVGDVEGIASAMTWMLDRPDAAREMGKRGEKFVADYDLPHIIKLHEALYAQAMQEASSPVWIEKSI